MKIELITKEEFSELRELIQKLDEKIDSSNRTLTKIVRSKQLREFLGGISDSALINLRTKGIIPFIQIEKTYYYDLESVLKALKEHEKQPQFTMNPPIGVSKPPPPMDLLNLNFRNPLQ